MLHLLSLTVFWGIALHAIASPFLVNDLSSRHDTISTINARVVDHGGLDVTSSFHIMLYNEPENLTTMTNYTDRRRQPMALARSIVDCQVPNAIFVDSVCTYKDNKAAGMQAWDMSCFTQRDHFDPKMKQYNPRFPSFIRRVGRCDDDEVCVNGLGRGGGSRYGQHSVASCVKKQYFTRMVSNAGKSAGERHSIVDLEKKRVQMVVSKTDGSTPLEVDTFDVEAVDAMGDTVQSKKCRDCMQLKSDPLKPQTDGLKAEATLLTTGAIAGILWLAVLSR